MNVIHSLLADVPIPSMVKIRQNFDPTHLPDVAAAVRSELSRGAIMSAIQPEMEIAITCGSRRLDNLALILKTVADFCRERGAKPFIFPAMGSHGGSTAQGQREICESYGVTEEYCGCPIRSSMEVEEIGRTASGLPACIDRYAAQADGIIAVNRIKAHPGFSGRYESGLMKMMVIGMGKQIGAETCHSAGFGKFPQYLYEIGTTILQNARVICGLGILENAYDQTREIVGLTAEEIPQCEPELLLRAKCYMPRLLAERCDVLVVDWMGKDISGSGMDANITGRSGSPYKKIDNFSATRVVALNLTDESHGSMGGVGNADIINRRIFEKGNLELTYPNSITHTYVKADAIPMMMDTDRLAVQCAIKTCAYTESEPEIIHIRDTLHLNDIYVSENLARRLEALPEIEILSGAQPWQFDEEGTSEDSF